MKRMHALIAALSLGGTIAAVSATQAAVFDPVRAGSMDGPGAAVDASAEHEPWWRQFFMRELPAGDLIWVGGAGARSMAGLTDAALDLSSAEAVPLDVVYFKAGDVIHAYYLQQQRPQFAGGAGPARSIATEATLDLRPSSDPDQVRP
ncbi:MAG TPA: hypothetical protein VK698_17505 [Kofleriaceae bacterium]|nr:hypothetical protein [Kofleriaceae bacterium]